uniref:Uncharacterized protein n=1 Tax=Lepeophtheirus salmonis TaxID=72036 RepID=A0A0K2UTK7_LEPSM
MVFNSSFENVVEVTRHRRLKILCEVLTFLSMSFCYSIFS